MSYVNYHGNKPSLTVSELILALQKMPGNLQVVFEWEGQEISITEEDIEFNKTSGFVNIDVNGYGFS